MPNDVQEAAKALQSSPAAEKPLLICLTGGGTAGHVTPHFALLPGIRRRGWQVFYIGSNGLEKPLVEAQGIEFHAVQSGKLRRYLSLQNGLDLFKVVLGFLQALFLLVQRRPDAVFSKGGFVAVPVAWAAWALRVPVVSHESDVTPGLANRLIAPLAKKIVYTFPETKKHLKGNSEHVGTPIRQELLQGDASRGLALCGFQSEADLATFLVMGGSQGAQRINEALQAVLPTLLERARVIHITGAGKGTEIRHPRYKAFEFVRDDLKDLFALADFVISRAGANSIFEFLALKKPMLLIPLEQGSRGDQVVNAEAFERSGWALVLREKNLGPEAFLKALENLEQGAADMRSRQAAFEGKDASALILSAIADATKR